MAVAGPLNAQDCKTPSPDVQALVKRLEAAEARIQSLESELSRRNDSRADAPPIPVKSESRLETPLHPASDVAAPDDGIDVSRLSQKWEQRWDDQEQLNAELKKSLKKRVQSGTSDTATMKVIGRVHVDYWGFPESDRATNVFENGNPVQEPASRIGFRRMRFGVRGDVNPLMDYRIEMEFAGGNRSEFRDAWIGIKELPVLQTLLIGNQKRPYGFDHLNSSRYNVFIERPFVIESFNQDARRLGICSYGVSEDQAWNWRYGVYNQRLIQDEGNYSSQHVQGEIAGRLANTAWYDECSGGRGYYHWAISGTVAHPDGDNAVDGADAINEARFRHRPEARTRARWLDTGVIPNAQWYEMLGLESVLNLGPLQMVAEYQNLWMQRDAGSSDLHLHGGYAYVSHFLTGEHIPWSRKSGTLGRVKPFENFFLVDMCDGGCGHGWGAWQVAVRYSYADFTDDDVFGGLGESVTIGLNWHWNSNTRWQFNYIFGRIARRNVSFAPPSPLAGQTFTGGDYQIVGTRFMIDY